MNSLPFEVRLLRLFPFAAFGIGLLVAWFGGWVVFGLAQAGIEHYGDLTVETTVSPHARWLGLIPLFLGVIVVLREFTYLVKPPVVLRIDDQGVSFGTGFGYVPYTIPLKLVESVTDLKVAVVIKFKESKEIPLGLITSAGISYSLYLLRIGRFYMDKSPAQVVEVLNALLEKNLPQDTGTLN